MERINVQVEEGTRDKLIELAGGERAMGAYISYLVADAFARQNLATLAMKVQTMDKMVTLIADAVAALNESVDAIASSLAAAKE